MIKEILDSLKTDLEKHPENPPVELFFRDISQYNYLGTNPVAVLNFRGVDFEKPPHTSFLEQKGVLDISFFHFSRTLENSNADDVFAFFESLKSLEGLSIQSFKIYSRKKNTSVWEIKTQVVRMF